MLFMTFGCNNPEAPDCFQRAGRIDTIEEGLPFFEELELNDLINYQLHPSEECSIKITGPENWINEVDFKVQNGKLIIQDKNRCQLIRNKSLEITVDVYAPNFKKIINQSMLKVEVMDTLYQSKLKWINENAPSNSVLLFHGDSCIIEMPKGTGDLEIKGQSFFTAIYSNAIGKVDASQMKSEYLNCNHSSLQNIYAQVSKYLFVVFENKGNLVLPRAPIQVDVVNNDGGQLIIE